jgi:hypothetical protein
MNALQVKPLVVPARITANTNGPAIDLRSYDGRAMIALNAGATEGAGQTLDVKIQHSADGSTGWADATVSPGGGNLAFAQVTNAAGGSAQVIEFVTKDLKRYIRAVQTLGGTSPAVTAGVSLIAKAQGV